MSVGRALEQGCGLRYQESDRVGRHRDLKRFRAVMPSAGAVVIATLAVLLIDATAASASPPPPNDEISRAFPAWQGRSFSEELDTTGATADVEGNDDAALSAACAPAANVTDASVWFVYFPSDGGVIVDVSSSSYSAGVIVARGWPGSLEPVACASGQRIGFRATAETGMPYYIMVFDSQHDGGGNGGTLQISIEEAPLPTVNATIDPTGTADRRTGTATVTGMLTCTDTTQIDMSARLSQLIGERSTTGSWSVSDQICDGIWQPWTAVIVPQSGRFAAGKATMNASTTACSIVWCAFGTVRQTVRLQWRPDS